MWAKIFSRKVGATINKYFTFAQKGRKEVIAAHEELRERIIYQAYANHEAKLWLSKADQEIILAFEYMEIRESLNTSYFKDMITADTFIYEDGLASRQFVLEGYGVVYGGISLLE